MIQSYETWGAVQRPWGYEKRVDALDEDGGRHPFCMTWPGGDPGEKAVADEVTRRIAHLEARLAEPDEEPEHVYAESEVVDLLVEKGYLERGDTLADLDAKTVEVVR